MSEQDSERDPRDGRKPEDIRNGWSFESRLNYHEEQRAMEAMMRDPARRRKKRATVPAG